MRIVMKLIAVCLFFVVVITLEGCIGTRIEEAVNDAGIDYARILSVKTVNGGAIVFYEKAISPELGIGFLEKKLIGWEWIGGGWFINLAKEPELSSPHFYWGKIGKKEYYTVYGIFKKQEVQGIEIIVFNKGNNGTEVMHRNAEVITTEKGERLWFVFIDSPSKRLNFQTATVELEGNKMMVKIFTKILTP